MKRARRSSPSSSSRSSGRPRTTGRGGGERRERARGGRPGAPGGPRAQKRRPTPPAAARPTVRRAGPGGAATSNPEALRAHVTRLAWDSIVPHLLKAGVDVEHATDRLRDYTALLLDWNRNVSNLIARSDEPRVLARHIAESVEPAHWLKAAALARWLDFGSGGGLPALPLAICGVGARWTLVESRRTKTLFLRKALQDIVIGDIEVVQERLEDVVLDRDRHGAYDGFTSRATLALGPTLVLAAPLIVPGGKAFLWKGSRREQEMAEDTRWTSQWDFDGLLGIGDGHAVVARFTRKIDR